MLFDNWLNSNKFQTYNFYNDYALIQSKKTKLYNFINKHGNFLFKNWYVTLKNYNKNGTPVFIENNGWNYIDKNEKILYNKYYDEVDNFKDGYALVKLNKKYNFINIDGVLISKVWFDYVEYCFGDVYYIVRLNGKINIINVSNKQYLSCIWFDRYSIKCYFKCFVSTGEMEVEFTINNDKYKMNDSGNITHFLDG